MLDRQASIGADCERLAPRLAAIFADGIAHPFFDEVLGLLLDALGSAGGCFAYVDEFGDLVVPAQQTVPGGFPLEARYPREACSEAFCRVLEHAAVYVLSEPHRPLSGTAVRSRGLAVPIVFGREAIGLLYASDKPRPYDASDELRARFICDRVAPFLFARNAQRRFHRQLAELEHMANAAVEGERFFMLTGDLMVISHERITRVNPAFTSLLGWDEADLRDKVLSDIAHPADRADLAGDVARMRSEPNREHPPIVVRMLAKSGEFRSIEWTGVGTDEGRVYAVGRDVSELRSAVARLAAQNEELQILHEHVRREQRMAGHLLANVRRQGCLDLPGVRHLTTPLDFFNGDVALAARTPDGQLRWMLGDFTGHGLTAAVGTIPIASAFYATARKGISIGESISTINDMLKGLLPAGLFCAGAFLNLDLERGELSAWNGGLPAVIVRSAPEGQLRRVPSQSLPLGLVSSRELNAQPVSLAVRDEDEVLVFTDGLTEARDAHGELFGADRVSAVLAKPGPAGDGFDKLVQALTQFRGSMGATDDVSLIAVTVGRLRLFDPNNRTPER